MKMKIFGGAWNPYIAGALVGLLAIVSAVATTKIIGKTSFLGASTTFVRAAGFVQESIEPSRIESNEYLNRYSPVINWQFMLVVGIFIGAMASALSDRSFRFESVPPIWKERFGTKIALRGFWAFAGGVLAIIGVRLANGCPSGHGLSGMMQLSASGFTAMVFFFGSGVIAANLIYRRRT